MQFVEIKIKEGCSQSRKYAKYSGHKFYVYDQVDNNGDATIAFDKGQPFVFISHKDCVLTGR